MFDNSPRPILFNISLQAFCVAILLSSTSCRPRASSRLESMEVEGTGTVVHVFGLEGNADETGSVYWDQCQELSLKGCIPVAGTGRKIMDYPSFQKKLKAVIQASIGDNYSKAVAKINQAITAKPATDGSAKDVPKTAAFEEYNEEFKWLKSVFGGVVAKSSNVTTDGKNAKPSLPDPSAEGLKGRALLDGIRNIIGSDGKVSASELASKPFMGSFSTMKSETDPAFAETGYCITDNSCGHDAAYSKTGIPLSDLKCNKFCYVDASSKKYMPSKKYTVENPPASYLCCGWETCN